MDTILAIWEWIKENHALVAEAVLAILLAASLIAKLTPSEADDIIVKKIEEFVKKILSYFGLEPKKPEEKK